MIKLLEECKETIDRLSYAVGGNSQEQSNEMDLSTMVLRTLNDIVNNDILIINSSYLDQYIVVKAEEPVGRYRGRINNTSRLTAELELRRTVQFAAEEILSIIKNNNIDGMKRIQENMMEEMYSFLVQDQIPSLKMQFPNKLVIKESSNKGLLELIEEAIKDAKRDHFEVSSEKASDYTNGIKTGLELALSIVKE